MSHTKILIFVPNWIGDNVMSTPLIHSIRKKMPLAKICILCNPYIASIWKYENIELIISNYSSDKKIAEYWNLFKIIKKRKFDVSINLTGVEEFSILSWLNSIPQRFGFKKQFTKFFHTQSIQKDEARHFVYDIHSFIGLLNLSEDQIQLKLTLNDTHLKYAQDFFTHHNLREKKLVIGFATESMFGPARCWPFLSYLELAQNLHTKFNAQILFFIGPNTDPENFKKEVNTSTNFQPIIIPANKDIINVAALIKNCHYFVNNDSGLMHIAAAVQTKTFVIFGSSKSIKCRPFGLGHLVISAKVACQPCMSRECRFEDYACMNLITPEFVFSKISSAMSTH